MWKISRKIAWDRIKNVSPSDCVPRKFKFGPGFIEEQQRGSGKEDGIFLIRKNCWQNFKWHLIYKIAIWVKILYHRNLCLINDE